MKIGNLRKELRFHIPVLVLVAGCATAVAAKTLVVDTTLSKPAQTVTKSNAELRAELMTPNLPEGVNEALQTLLASDTQVEAPQVATEGLPNGMVLGSVRAWFEGVQGEDNFTDDESLSTKLRVLWQHKMNVPGVKPSAQKAMETILTRFADNPKTKMDLKTFVERANKNVRDTHKHLDYKAFCSRMQMNKDECVLLEDITDDLRGRDMVAYGMTELLPSANGDRNIEILDKVLQTAGIEFLNSVPAFGDPLLSEGLYQFTSYAVRNDVSGLQGASIVNQFVDREYQIPGSVMLLSSDDQHRAAFLFTTYNVARWIKQMNRNQMKMFRHLMPKHQSELIEYIAVSHHMPARTIAYANAWLDRKGKDDFLDFLPAHLRAYGAKTQMNYKALKAFLS